MICLDDIHTALVLFSSKIKIFISWKYIYICRNLVRIFFEEFFEECKKITKSDDQILLHIFLPFISLNQMCTIWTYGKQLISLCFLCFCCCCCCFQSACLYVFMKAASSYIRIYLWRWFANWQNVQPLLENAFLTC